MEWVGAEMEWNIHFKLESFTDERASYFLTEL